MNAIDLLKQQHKKTTAALEKAHESGAAPAELKKMADELVAHMVIEEHIFYPRVKQLMKSMINESFEEHAVARFELARLLQASGEDKKTRALVLKELLEHHIEEEEKEMFPKVKRDIPAAELDALGVKMHAAFETAVAKGLEAFFQPSRPARRTGTNGATAAHAR
ncbi:MAG: hemerythrin domain-containing protein [Labilithrix sp.]|nr:hemerythrin domain-containing protein [Labilithrix sp.]MCW5810884.1 hemerythrin domain-containing protein [Labilithrix sp.]